MNKKERIAAFEKALGKETVYFRDAFEDAVFKAVPKDGIYVKRRDTEEFKAKDGSGLVAEALRSPDPITEQEYADFT